MTIQQFIEKAIEGGWNPWRTVVMPQPAFLERVDYDTWSICDNPNFELSAPRGRIKQAVMFLDPEAWKAVGKVEEWALLHKTYCASFKSNGECDCREPEWPKRMHRMIDALAKGKTIEQYLETL